MNQILVVAVRKMSTAVRNLCMYLLICDLVCRYVDAGGKKYLRIIVVSEAFGKGVVVNFQLRDLQVQGEGMGQKSETV